MKISFSTLACPDWTLPSIVAIASSAHYDGIELRFVENEDSLWKLPPFRGAELAVTRRLFADHALEISCVDTSCRFHFPDPAERARWLEEGRCMGALAAELGSPGIRVFGDTVQEGADLASTRKWVADCVHQLAESIPGVEVWLETHGDFASAQETVSILAQAACCHCGAIWDPGNCFLHSKEKPADGAARLGGLIRHVHVKDFRLNQGEWRPVLTAQGDFPLAELRSALVRIEYAGFISFEWEKKWHKEIPDASLAVPHFARWYRENWM